MSPRRTRSGKVLSTSSTAAPRTIARPTAPNTRVVRTTRAKRVRAGQAEQNQGEEIQVEREGRIEEEFIVAEEINIVGEVVDETNIQIGETNEQVEEIEVNTTPSEHTMEEVNAAPSNIDDSDAIEIVSESVNDSVIDLTDDTATTTNSPLRLGGHWSATHSFLARLPPNPWATPRPAQPPVMVDLTDSPANIQGQDIMNDNPTEELDTTSSPGGGGGISVQCPVCLESLKSIKKSGSSLVSTVCGHIFCSRCLPASLRASGRCPTCRRRVGPTEYHKIFI